MSAAVVRPATLGGLAVVVLAAFVISVNNVLAPLVYATGSNPLTLVSLRFGGFILMGGAWLALARSPGLRALPRRDALECLGAGLVFTAGASCLLLGFAYAPVSLVVLVFYLYPLMTIGLDALIGRRRPELRQILCAVAALAGLALALQALDDRVDRVGLLFGFLAALGLAGAFTWSGRRLAHIDSTVSTFLMSAAGFAVVTAGTLAAGRFDPGALTPDAVWLIAAAILTFSAAFFLMFAGVRLVGATRAAMLMNLEPVFTIALSVAVLAETLSGRQWLGTAIVVAAVTVAQWPGRGRQLERVRLPRGVRSDPQEGPE